MPRFKFKAQSAAKISGNLYSVHDKKSQFYDHLPFNQETNRNIWGCAMKTQIKSFEPARQLKNRQATDSTQNMIEGRMFIATHHSLCRSGEGYVTRATRLRVKSHGSYYSQARLVTAGTVVTAGAVTLSTVVTVGAASGPEELARSES